MSKRAVEKANKACPINKGSGIDRVMSMVNRKNGYILGYEQAEKDIISLIESRISEILGDAQPSPVLRMELQGIIDKIKNCI